MLNKLFLHVSYNKVMRWTEWQPCVDASDCLVVLDWHKQLQSTHPVDAMCVWRRGSKYTVTVLLILKEYTGIFNLLQFKLKKDEVFVVRSLNTLRVT